MATKSKPFIAARIPEDLNNALDKHANATGENRTTTIINALSSYLKWSSPEVKKTISAGDRLSLLEKRVKELEKLFQNNQKQQNIEKEPEKSQQLVIVSDNESDNTSKTEVDNTDNKDKELSWMTSKEAHNLYGAKYTHDSFRKFKPERLKKEFGLVVERILKEGHKKPQLRFRKLPD